MNKFFVTGAAGFLGSALVERLLKNKHKVIGLDRRSTGFLSSEVVKHKNFKFFSCDLTSSSFDKLKLRADFNNLDGIFHLAAQQPLNEDLDYINFYKGNVETTLNLINFVKTNGAKFIIFSSTCSIFMKYPNEKYISEDSSVNPQNYYSLTKYIAERLLKIGLRNTKTKVIVIRFPSLFGKHHLGGLVYTYYQLIKKHKDVEVYNKGKRYRNLLYLKDAVDALLKIVDKIDRFRNFKLFVCGSRDSLKMSKIAKTLKELTASRSKIILSDKNNPADYDLFIDLSKAKRALNFVPSSIKENLKFYVKEMNEKI